MLLKETLFAHSCRYYQQITLLMPVAISLPPLLVRIQYSAVSGRHPGREGVPFAEYVRNAQAQYSLLYPYAIVS